MTSPDPSGSFHHSDAMTKGRPQGSERGGAVMPGADFAAGPISVSSGRRNHRHRCAHGGERRARTRLPIRPGASIHRPSAKPMHRTLRHSDAMGDVGRKREPTRGGSRKCPEASPTGARRTPASRATRLEGTRKPAADPSPESAGNRQPARCALHPSAPSKTPEGGGRNKRTTGRACGRVINAVQRTTDNRHYVI